MKKERPLIDVAHVSMARRSYTLSEDAADLLEEYANFLSDFTKFRVLPGDIVGKLSQRLRRDDLFMKWQVTRKDKETVRPEKSKNSHEGERPNV
jgi:hypothetical protein